MFERIACGASRRMAAYLNFIMMGAILEMISLIPSVS